MDLGSADTTPPSVPANLAATLQGTQASLTWSASTDDVGVTGYKVYSGGTLLGTSTAASYTASSLMSGVTYSFTVKATDAAGNTSGASNTATVTVPDTTAPKAPASLTATLQGTQANLSWTASTDNVGVTSYQIYNNTTLLGTSTAASYTASSLVAGTTYSFTIKATDAAGNTSGASNTATVTVPAGTLLPPTNLTAAVSGSSIHLSWDSAANASGYNLYRNSIYIGSYGTTYTNDNNVVAGITYTYTVQTYDSSGKTSALSAGSSVTIPDTTAPTAPTALTATLQGTQANLSWTASTDNVGVTAYQIYNNTTLLGTSTAASYTASSLVAGTTYSFTVKATDAAGNTSGASNIATVTVPVTLAPPTNLTAGVYGNGVHLRWTASVTKTVTGYIVARNGIYLNSYGTTNVTDSTAVKGKTYTYKVQAYDAAGRLSAFSNSATVTR
jgi:chitodextrinase